MDNQDGFDHALKKRTVQEIFEKLLSPVCKAFPKAPGCPKPEEPVEAPPPSTTPTSTPAPAPAPAATSPPAVIAPPPVETKTQPASPPVATQPPVVVAPPATTAPAVVKPSATSITPQPQPTKGAEQVSGSNPETKSGGGSGQGNGSGSGPESNGADKGNAVNAGNDGSSSGSKGATKPVGSENNNDNTSAVPRPSVTSHTTEVQPTATPGSYDVNGVFGGNVLLAAPMPAPSHSSESGEHTVGDDTSGDGDNWVQGSQPSATSYHSAIQHNDQAISTTLSTAWVAAGTPTSIPSGESTTMPGQASGSDDPSRGNPDLYPTPGSTHTQTGGGGSTTGNSDSPTVDSPTTSNTGLVSGIAGGVVTIVVLFFILLLLLYRYRRTARVQNFLIKYTPLKVAAYTKRDKKRSSMGRGLLYEDDEPSSPTMTEKGKTVNYGTILPAPVTQPNPTACRAPTKAIPPPADLDTAHGLRSPTPGEENRHSMFERVSTSMSDYFPQPPSPTHSHHSRGNSVESLGGVSIASSGIFSASMLPPSTACSNSTASWALPPSTSHSQATQFQPLQPMPMPMSMTLRPSGLSTQPPMTPRDGQAGPSNWRDRPDSWGF